MMYTRKKILRITLLMVIALQFSQHAAGTKATGYYGRMVGSDPEAIASPFVHPPDNTLTNLLEEVPEGSEVLKYEGGEFQRATFEDGAWDKGEMTLNPGEGAFFLLRGADEFRLVFSGTVAEGELTQALEEGLSFVSSRMVREGLVTQDLNLQLNPFDNLYLWQGNGYATYTYLPNGSWHPKEPSLSIGESFFVNVNSPTNWTQTLEINP